MEAADLHVGQALTAVRKGYKLSRAFWLPGSGIKMSADQRTVEFEAIDANGIHIAPWNPQSDDMSATDWFIVN